MLCIRECCVFESAVYSRVLRIRECCVFESAVYSRVLNAAVFEAVGPAHSFHNVVPPHRRLAQPAQLTFLSAGLVCIVPLISFIPPSLTHSACPSCFSGIYDFYGNRPPPSPSHLAAVSPYYSDITVAPLRPRLPNHPPYIRYHSCCCYNLF